MKIFMVMIVLFTVTEGVRADMYMYEEETPGGTKIMNITEEENPMSSSEIVYNICKAGGNSSLNGEFCEDAIKKYESHPPKKPILLKRIKTN
jgi:hypothetical protein